AEERQAFMEKITKLTRSRLALWLTLGWLSVLAAPMPAEEAPKRTFDASDKALTLQISENLSLSAETLAPENDPATGAMTGLAASGKVIIKAKPNGAKDWITVSCDKAIYKADGDVIVLTGWPAVKSGLQILRATSAETYVRVARASGKWEIKGPHKIELNLGKKPG
ncbi:MAG: hypothetical protein KDM63_16665, partial [Verrucomicrobiae bacterium]|nr:hypothetical protein [Verrucomicrobiae bacterium]